MYLPFWRSTQFNPLYVKHILSIYLPISTPLARIWSWCTSVPGKEQRKRSGVPLCHLGWQPTAEKSMLEARERHSIGGLLTLASTQSLGPPVGKTPHTHTSLYKTTPCSPFIHCNCIALSCQKISLTLSIHFLHGLTILLAPISSLSSTSIYSFHADIVLLSFHLLPSENQTGL